MIKEELNETGQFYGFESEFEDIAEDIAGQRGTNFYTTLAEVKEAYSELLQEAGQS